MQRLVTEQEELQCIQDVLSQTARLQAPKEFDNTLDVLAMVFPRKPNAKSVSARLWHRSPTMRPSPTSLFERVWSASDSAGRLGQDRLVWYVCLCDSLVGQ